MDPKPIRIYSVEDSPRLRYIAEIILGDILGLPWEVTSDKRKLRKCSVINYSSENIAGSFRILPHPLLFEKGVFPREINISRWSGLPVFFCVPGEADLPFDIFAASFFLISRYEEYTDHEADEHGRFRASSSLAFKNGFLGIPVVDLWVKEMSKVFLRKFSNIAFKRNEFRSMLTIDTDQAYAYLGKNIMRSLGGVVNDILNKNHKLSERYRTITQGRKDPFDVFEYLSENIEKNQVDAKFFFPVGDYSKYDKNPSWKNVEYRKLITGIAARYKTGLHPSYNSAGNAIMLRTEKERLSSIVEKDVTSSRYHFIKLSMPQSYRDLWNEGITGDYSMGYPDEVGFRAGIARPYCFYDVTEDKPTGLKVYPFQVMDGTMFQYKGLGPDVAKDLILKMINETRKVGGLFISIWHNTSLLDDEQWRCWREVFEFMLKNQAYDNLS